MNESIYDKYVRYSEVNDEIANLEAALRITDKKIQELEDEKVVLVDRLEYLQQQSDELKLIIEAVENYQKNKGGNNG